MGKIWWLTDYNNRESLIKITSICAAAILGIGGITGVVILRKNYVASKYDETGTPKRFSHGIDEEEISKVSSYLVENGQAVKKFRSSAIYFLINKETNEIAPYLYFYGDKFNNEEIRFRLFELDSEELISYEYPPDLFDPGYTNNYYFDYLKDNFDWIPLTSASTYVEGFKLKDSYTKEEVKEIEPKLLDGYLLIKEAKKTK